MSTIRLNKLLAIRGVGARRKCDRLIESGVVRVNGEVVTAPGARVVEGRDRITISGRPLPERATHRYLMLNKPVGVITTLRDPEGRRTVADLIPREGRLYPVGRLDADTSGLLIVTNDGALAHHLMHPRYGLTKFYRVLIAEEPNDGQLARLAAGVEFEPGLRSAPARVRRRDPVPRGAVIEIALHEGRHRQVRRMCEAVGMRVLGLHRWAYGPLKLGELERGIWRELSEEEVAALRSTSARVAPRPAWSGRGRPRAAPRSHEFGFRRERRGADEPSRPRELGFRRERPGAGGRPRSRELQPRLGRRRDDLRQRPRDDVRRGSDRRGRFRGSGPRDDARRGSERSGRFRGSGPRVERSPLSIARGRPERRPFRGARDRAGQPSFRDRAGQPSFRDRAESRVPRRGRDDFRANEFRRGRAVEGRGAARRGAQERARRGAQERARRGAQERARRGPNRRGGDAVRSAARRGARGSAPRLPEDFDRSGPPPRRRGRPKKERP